MNTIYRFILTLVILLVTSFQSFTQTETLQGIINEYTTVSSIEQCDGLLEVSDASNFNVGDKVLIIQMQGALMNATNTAVFGSLDSMQDIRSAGLYEKNEIIGISGNLISLQFALLNTYNLDGKVQLVSVPVYTNASVNSTLTAKAWDGETGGIIALEVTNELRVNGSIDANGLGFRGGKANNVQIDSCASVAFLGPITSYFTNLGNWRGAQKGEGIAAHLTNKEAGRGAQINGGGGANDHQAGGGGGAHHTPGGNGGELESLGACKGLFPGIGAYNLEDTAERIFFGGGGGGGHGNTAATDGGNGGGIIMITANRIGGNGMISANGIDAVQALQEGAGGGGAGGSILLDISATLTTGIGLQLAVRGGKGGDTDSQGDPRCFGPGGGGSGGRIYTTLGSNLNASRAGGEVGRVLNSTGACTGTSNSASTGGPGAVKIFQGLNRSNISLANGPDIAACGEATGSSVQFLINDIGVEYYEYFTIINDGIPSETDTTSASMLEINGLNSTDVISLIIQGVGGVCNTVADTVICFPTDCSGVSLEATTNIASVYCLDTFPRPLTAEPAGGVFLGAGVGTEATFTPSLAGLGEHELFYQYTDSLGCVRLDTYTTQVITQPEAPVLLCSNADEGSVEFTWTHPSSNLFRVVSTVNGALLNLPTIINGNSFTQTNLNPNDVVEIRVVALNQDCGDSEEAVEICIAQSCPSGSININPPSVTTFCTEDPSIQIEALPTGGVFLGEGIDSIGLFDPSTVSVPADSSAILVDVVYKVAEITGCPPTLDTLSLTVQARTAPPLIQCGNNTINTIEFILTHPLVSTYELTYSVNSSPFVTETFTGTSFLLDGLQADDSVELSAIAIDVNGCGNSDIAVLECVANPCPIVEPMLTGLATEYCISDAAVQLSGTPIGGIFRGDGVNNVGLFTPNEANLGTNVIVYSFMSAEGCQYADTLITEILAPIPAPILSCNSTANSIDFAWISDATSFEYTLSINGTPMGAAQVTNDNNINIPDLNSGDVVEFSVKVLADNFCGDSEIATTSCQTTICTTAPPEILNVSSIYCTNDANVLLEGTPAGGIFQLDNEVISILSPANLEAGFYLLSYTVTDQFACEQTQSRNIEIVGLPEMPMVTCGDSTTQSVQFQFDNPDSDFFLYSIAVNGTTILVDTTNATSVDFAGLQVSDSVAISLAPLDVFVCSNIEQTTQVCYPQQCTPSNALIDVQPFYCYDTTAVQIFAEPSGGIFNGNGITQDGIFTPSDVVEGPTTITYSFSDANGCPQLDTFMTEVIALPIAPILDCSERTEETASFVWTHPDPDARFQYSISINGDAFSTPVVTTERTFTQTNLSPGTTITIRVSTLSEQACGISEPVSFTCTTEDCPAVEAPILSCGNSTPNSVEFTWTHPDPEVQFEYEIRVDGSFSFRQGITADTQIIETDLNENETVFIRIVARGDLGCPSSETVELACTTAACTSAEVMIEPIPSVCLGIDDTPIDLVANFPDIIDVLDFSWSGEGVIGTTFDPTTAGLTAGTVQINYTLTAVDGCVYEATGDIELLECGDAGLSGIIRTEEGKGVNAVRVELLGEISQSTQSDFTGAYTFEDVESGIDYQMQLSRQDAVLNGVSVFDMVVIRKHILAVDIITSPYKLLAADVNNSGSVTTADLVMIRQALLNIIPDFPAGVWRFVPEDYVFPDPSNPWSAPDGGQNFDILGLIERNFIAIKVGDINGNAFTD